MPLSTKHKKTDEPASSAAGPLRTRGGFLLFPGPGASAPGFLVFVLSVLLRGIWNTRPSLSVRMYKSRAARLEQHAISFFSFALSM